jgi:glycerophosphoryl diester phosphodiesterase
MSLLHAITALTACLILTGDACADQLLSQAAAGVRQIIAHRGSSSDRPENTLAALRRAIEAGATAVEIDIRTTKDGRLVLSHDASLSRITHDKSIIGDKTLAEIQSLDAGSWFDPRYRDERIPTLAQALEVCRGKIDVLLDLKEQGQTYIDRVVHEVITHGEPARTIVGVRTPEQAKQFRQLLPHSRQLGLIPDPGSIEAFAAAGVEMIRLWPKWLGDDSLVPRIRKAGAKLHLNNTSGSPEEVHPLLAYAPDSISSDDPARLVATLAALRSPERHKPN